MTRRYKMTINGGEEILFDHPSEHKMEVMSGSFRAIRVWKSERLYAEAQLEWYELSAQGVQALFMDGV